MKIAFLISTLGQGGAERVAAILCNYWVRSGHQVEMITLEKPGTVPAYKLDDGVAVRHLDMMSDSRTMLDSVCAGLRRIQCIRSELCQFAPDVAVAFMTEMNVMAVIAGARKSWRTVISERIHPRYHPVPAMYRNARRIAYSRADALVVQTRNIGAWYRREMGLETHVIANPVELSAFKRPGSAGSRSKQIVAIGRLAPQKGFDLLIEAFGAVASDIPDWTLAIYGEGPSRTALEKQISSLGMKRLIRLPGATDDVAPILQAAGIYVHPARYEGFPNSLVEALAAGCCVVATDCPGASGEILLQGEYGVLVPPDNVAELARQLLQFAKNSDLRAKYENCATEAVRKFDADKIAQSWIDMLVEISEAV